MHIKHKIAVIVMCVMMLAGLTACASDSADAPAETPVPTPVPTQAPPPVDYSIVINEFMEKNRAVIAEEDGDFPDWIELYNSGTETVNLKGWRLSDDPEKKGWKFPDVSLAPGEYLLVFASNKEKDSGGELHADFAISADEGVYLKDAYGRQVSEALCTGCDSDVSMAMTEQGWGECRYPTPGQENSKAGYDMYQQSLAPGGPLVINEVMVYDDSVLSCGTRGYCDWVEIKNISSQPVQLSEYYLSDDDDNYQLYNLPEYVLQPGICYVLSCDDTEGEFVSSIPNTGFSLSSSNEQLFLSRGADLVDYCSLRLIPYGASYGRLNDRSGWFYMAEPSPGMENTQGCRGVSETPVSLTKDGVYDGVESVKLELEGSGVLRYTLDGSAPTEESPVYEGAIELEKTGVVRVSSFEDDALPSLPLSLSFIINEGHELPVLSLLTDSPYEFDLMYRGRQKGVEKSGSLSLYRDGGGFTIGCGVSLNGETSLLLPKKNMSVRFRGAYGSDTLQHDIYGGGVTEFTNLLLRSGQDFEQGIIRNELAQELCAKAELNVINQRSIWCVLYINGEYSGLYTLKEKANEQLYASLCGLSRDSVQLYEAPVPYDTDFQEEVVSFVMKNDMSIPENYEHFCSVMDVDSLIDWLIMQGFCSNTDINLGNLRYVRSTENDGKWRLMFYDLDAAFRYTGSMFTNTMTDYAAKHLQIGTIARNVMVNPQFKDSFLTRAAELMSTVLTNEMVLSEIDRLAAQVAPEVERDYKRFGRTLSDWETNLDVMRQLITVRNWRQCAIDSICFAYELEADERAYYFGEIDGK